LNDRTKRYWEFVNNEWFHNLSDKTILVSGYRSDSIRRPDNTAKVLAMGNVRVALVNGHIQYFDNKKVQVKIKDGCWDIKNTVPNELLITTANDSFAIYITPIDNDSNKNIEEAKQRIEVVATIGVILFGTHLIYEHLFENVYKIEKNGKETISSFFDTLKSVIPFDEISISNNDLIDYETIGNKLNTLDSNKKAKICLAARWHYKGLKETHPVDEFLCYWIALEILAMPDTTNIRPIAQRLAKIYNLTEKELRERLSLGRLFDFRSKIVHEGYRGGIYYYIIDCVRSIFLDILQDEIGFFSVKASELYIKDGKIKNFLPD